MTLPDLVNHDDPMLRLAVAAHLARYKGETRVHTASDLNFDLRWCLERSLSLLQAGRAHIELYLRWLQEARRLRPSTVSRRLSVLATPAVSVPWPSALASPARGCTHTCFATRS